MINFIVWILGAAAVSFGISALFAGRLQMRRNYFLLIYLSISTVFIAAFYIRNGTDLFAQLGRNLIWGLATSAVVGFIAVRNVLRQQPYPRRTGMKFFIDVVWPGLGYGAVDGMLLSVLPVTAVYRTFLGMAWTTGFFGRLSLGCLALTVSLFITFMYHIGYPEFRNKRVVWTLFGNGLFSIAFIATGNPFAAVLPHIAMHIASVVYGRETTIQLPPHYPAEKRMA